MSIYGLTKLASLKFEARRDLQKNLALSVEEGNLSGVQICLNTGAYVTQEIVNIAIKLGHDEIKGALIEVHKQALALKDAINENNVDKVNSLIIQKVNVNRPCVKEFYIPLHLAASKGHYQIVEVLLRAGADKDMVTEPHLTALHQAVTQKQREIVNLLLDFGADPNIPLACAKSPLMTAAQKGDWDMVSLLLQRGADISYRAAQDHSIFDDIESKPQLHAILVEYYKTQSQGLASKEISSLTDILLKFVAMNLNQYQPLEEVLPSMLIELIKQTPERESLQMARRKFVQENLNAYPISFRSSLEVSPMELSDVLPSNDPMQISKATLF